jgi:hypothetical protein
MVHQLAHMLLSDDQVRAISGWGDSVVAVLVSLVAPRVFPQQPLPMACKSCAARCSRTELL